jgi:hypothetical protein
VYAVEFPAGRLIAYISTPIKSRNTLPVYAVEAYHFKVSTSYLNKFRHGSATRMLVDREQNKQIRYVNSFRTRSLFVKLR